MLRGVLAKKVLAATVCVSSDLRSFFLEARKAFPKPQLAEAFPEKKLPVKTAFHVLPAFLNMVVIERASLMLMPRQY